MLTFIILYFQPGEMKLLQSSLCQTVSVSVRSRYNSIRLRWPSSTTLEGDQRPKRLCLVSLREQGSLASQAERGRPITTPKPDKFNLEIESAFLTARLLNEKSFNRVLCLLRQQSQSASRHKSRGNLAPFDPELPVSQIFKATVGHKIIYSELHIIWTIKLHTPIRNPITCAWLKPLFQQASAHNLKISEEEESTTFIGILSQHLIIPTVKALGLILK